MGKDRKIFNSVFMTLSKIGTPIFYVRGEEDPTYVSDIYSNVYNVELREKDLNEFVIRGLPPAIDYELKIPKEHEVLKLYEKMSLVLTKKTIFLTHIPPFSLNVDKDYLRDSLGSVSVKEIIEKQKPFITICGHAHNGLGYVKIEGGIVINPGPFRRGYYAEILFDNIKVDVKLGRFRFTFEH